MKNFKLVILGAALMVIGAAMVIDSFRSSPVLPRGLEIMGVR